MADVALLFQQYQTIENRTNAADADHSGLLSTSNGSDSDDRVVIRQALTMPRHLGKKPRFSEQ